MPKNLIQQRRGRGTSVFRRPGHRFLGMVRHPREKISGLVKDILRDRARTAPVAIVEFENGYTDIMIAHEGMRVGQKVEWSANAEAIPGNTLPLKDIPDGTPIYNIEARPGDGGKFARASGVYGYLVSHDAETGKVTVKLPSKRLKTLDGNCMATIGVIAGGGRTEKPIVKAGTAHHIAKSKNKYYPRVSGVAMNPVSHPFGGGNHQHTGKPKTVSRRAPRGRKVGSIAARKTGKGGRRK